MTSNLANYLPSALIGLPWIGVIALVFVPERCTRIIKYVAGLTVVLPLAAGLKLAFDFRGVGGVEFSQYTDWMPALGITYWVGVDGISFALLFLPLTLIPLAMLLACRESRQVRTRAVLLLILESALLTAWLALDVWLFYFGFEVATLAVFALMGLQNKASASAEARRFLMLNLIGSALLLLTLAACITPVGGQTNLASLVRQPLGFDDQVLWASVFVVAITFKCALVPWHSSYRSPHGELSALMRLTLGALFLPVGIYAVLRFGYALFPLGLHSIRMEIRCFALLGLLIVTALAWTDRQGSRILSYFTIAMLAFALLGLTSFEESGVQGSLFLLLQHGWVLAVLSMVMASGLLAGERGYRLAITAGALAVLAAMAFPGSNSFAGIFMILLSLFNEAPVIAGLMVAAWTLLAMAVFFQRRQLRPTSDAGMHALKGWALWCVLPFLILIAMGSITPHIFTNKSNNGVRHWLSVHGQTSPAQTDKAP